MRPKLHGVAEIHTNFCIDCNTWRSAEQRAEAVGWGPDDTVRGRYRDTGQETGRHENNVFFDLIFNFEFSI